MKITREAEHAIEQALKDGRATETSRAVGPICGRAAVRRPVEYTLNLRLDCMVRSEMNQRCHWAKRRRRFLSQADALLAATRWMGGARPPGPWIVAFIHHGAKMDSDNLQGAFKGLRDAMADWLGLPDDDDDRVSWRYGQVLETKRDRQGVEVIVQNVTGS